MKEFEERKRKEIVRLNAIFSQKIAAGDAVGASLVLAQMKTVVRAVEASDDGKTFVINMNDK